MGLKTKIQWCDSSLNLEMGCDGCELWNGQRRDCYAGRMTARAAGAKGWPASFGEPQLFPERLPPALAWRDLTGTPRPEKPWLNGLPRLVFLDDEGDTFTESLPEDWLAEHLPAMAASPHVWIVLTKRPRRAVRFFERHGLPANVWVCTSVTNRATLGRVRDLLALAGKGTIGVSAEPLWEEVRLAEVPGFERLAWVKAGGQSGGGAVPCDLDWLRRVRDDCRGKVPFFCKQLGSRPLAGAVPLRLRDGHGGDWSEWPADLRVRQVPAWGRKRK